jgi:DNA-binding response OmpR family regulator
MPQKQKRRHAMRTRKQIVIFIDDHVDTCECFALALEHEGFHVLTAYDGEEGIALVNARRPDAVVTNLCMPRVDGWRVCQFVKSYAPTQTTAVVLLTGAVRADGGNRALAEDIGVRFIAKPCDPQELVGVLREMLASATLAASPAPARRRFLRVSDTNVAGRRNSFARKQAPNCPNCAADMRSAELDPEERVLRFRAGAPRPPPRKIPIWRCRACGFEQAREFTS